MLALWMDEDIDSLKSLLAKELEKEAEKAPAAEKPNWEKGFKAVAECLLKNG